MQFPAPARAAHGALSAANLRFLDHVAEHPECLERSRFDNLEGLDELCGYPLQAWPIFVDQKRLLALGKLNTALSRLVKAAPSMLRTWSQAMMTVQGRGRLLLISSPMCPSAMVARVIS